LLLLTLLALLALEFVVVSVVSVVRVVGRVWARSLASRTAQGAPVKGVLRGGRGGESEEGRFGGVPHR
jgi:hypothetical protein